jgi:hypothetical protein
VRAGVSDPGYNQSLITNHRNSTSRMNPVATLERARAADVAVLLASNKRGNASTQRGGYNQSPITDQWNSRWRRVGVPGPF